MNVDIETCLKKLPNRFQLTLSAAYRARQLLHEGTVSKGGIESRASVVALQEIFDGSVGNEMLKKVPLK